ncbi:hypothetical protein D6779_10560 [Candidatus Parcubacteria bacterium]|nr:MAG: hypothetical protein D6779_10560 [Candidatus Parcubacteria bacterium]
MTGELTVSSKLWQCFEVAYNAWWEACALLDEVDKKLNGMKISDLSINDGKKYPGWVNSNKVAFSNTRNYEVKRRGAQRPHHVLSVQVVFFAEECERRNCKQATINVVYSPYVIKGSEDNYWQGDFIAEWDDNNEFWKGIDTACDGKLLWKGGGDDLCWAFSYPVHAIAEKDDIEKKIVKPIKKLLSGDKPNDLSCLGCALRFKKEADEKIVVANNE